MPEDVERGEGGRCSRAGRRDGRGGAAIEAAGLAVKGDELAVRDDGAAKETPCERLELGYRGGASSLRSKAQSDASPPRMRPNEVCIGR